MKILSITKTKIKLDIDRENEVNDNDSNYTSDDIKNDMPSNSNNRISVGEGENNHISASVVKTMDMKCLQ